MPTGILMPLGVVEARQNICHVANCGACSTVDRRNPCVACPHGRWSQWDCLEDNQSAIETPTVLPAAPAARHVPEPPLRTGVRTMSEQIKILTETCPQCPHGMWKGDHCAACAGLGCFAARVARADQHCPRGEW
jgi:hypothetical protein